MPIENRKAQWMATGIGSLKVESDMRIFSLSLFSLYPLISLTLLLSHRAISQWKDKIHGSFVLTLSIDANEKPD